MATIKTDLNKSRQNKVSARPKKKTPGSATSRVSSKAAGDRESIQELKRKIKELGRLASFPVLNPNPIIEVESSGKIIFVNNAAKEILRKLHLARRSDVFLPGDIKQILKNKNNKKREKLYREITIGDRVFGEWIYFAPEFHTARIYAHDITDRKAADTGLQQAETLLRKEHDFISAILSTAGALVIVLDLRGRIVNFNNACEQLTGYSFKEVKGKCFWEFLLIPEEIAPVKSIFRDLKAGQFPNRFENFWVSREGIRYLISWANTALLDSKGNVEFIVGTGIDITSQRQTEENLKTAYREVMNEKNRLEAVMDALPIGIALADELGGNIQANQAFEQVWGSPRPLTKNVQDYIQYNAWWADTGKPLKPEEWASARSVQTGETVVGQVLEIERFDGTHAFVLNSAAPIWDANNRIVGCAVAIQDITTLRKAEEALKESEERLSMALYAGRVFGFEWNPQTDTVIRSNNCGIILGMSGDTATYDTGRDFFNRIHPEDRDAFISQIDNLTAEKNTYSINYRLVKTDGEIVVLEETAIGLFDSRGQLVKLYGMTADVTERARAEDTLLKSKGKLAILSETAGQLLASDNPQQIVDDLCRKVMNFLDCHVFFNYLIDDEKKRLHLNAYAGISAETATGIEWLDIGAAVCGCVARDRKRIIAQNIPESDDPRTDLVRSFGIKAYVCHPLVAQGKVIGTISFGSRSRISFTDDELDLMNNVTDQVSIAMQRVMHHQKLQKYSEELEREVQERTKEIREKAEIIDSLFKYTITPLVLLDREFNFIRVNQEYAHVCSKEIDDFYGHNHFGFYPHEENEAIFRKVVETKLPYQAVAKPFIFPDHPEWGLTYWDWTLTPLLDPDGEVKFLVFSLNNVTDRKKAEEVVNTERQRLYSVLEQIPAYVCLLTPDYKFAYTNQEFKRRFGDPVERCCYEFLFDRQKPCEDCMTYRVFSERKDQEWEWTGPDGKTYAIYDYLFIDSKGSPMILEMGIDVTEFKKVVKNLSGTSTLLDLFTKTTSRKEYIESVVPVLQQWSGFRCVGIRIMNDEGNIPYEAYMGFSQEFYKLENMLSLKNDMCACIRAVTGHFEPQDSSILTANGSICINNSHIFAESLTKEELARYRGNCIRSGFQSIVLVPVRYRGQTIGLIHLADEREGMAPFPVIQFLEAVANLIGEAIHRFNTEAALRKSETGLSEAQRIAHIGSWAWDIDSGRLSWSDEVYRIFGLSHEEFKPSYEAFLSFVHPDDRESLEEAIKEALYQKTSYAIDHRIVLPDGSEKFVHEQGEIIYDEKGFPLRMIGTVQDITRIKHIENELRLSEERLRELYAHLHSVREAERAHIAREIHDEFGTILTALNIDLSWLENKIPKDQQTLIERIGKDVELVNSAIKMVQRISSELRPAVLDYLGLPSAVEWQVKEFGDRTGLEWDIDIDMKTTDLDKDLSIALFRILQESLTNIARYAEATKINVALIENDGFLTLEVTDNGKGITEEQLFSPQSLGIFGMRERIEYLGGNIDIKGIPDWGTTVTVRVPIVSQGVKK
jgi:PAS domain S-box-containing protein